MTHIDVSERPQGHYYIWTVDIWLEVLPPIQRTRWMYDKRMMGFFVKLKDGSLKDFHSKWAK